ncbi:ATP-binding protein [Streptomyces sp. TRM68416]|uniref:ATP-binding protein n=1 Tax=Streptomyces sp. TRM68416 TaxID=2758412 RepID=UPI001661EA1C|nr:hypothetical protein [Streptomyces sp. TRM68416]MBD0837325.1 hypothetical protein [Streptomyces sp. TRM68416]
MSGKQREQWEPRPGNLPPETRRFIGRSAELTWLTAELSSGGEGRPLSLVGAGGVGKTGLALRAAGRAREAYPDGVWLVELSALRADGLVPLAVMEALGLADRTTGPATAAVLAWARDKRLLLILDSCEHLLAGCADLVADLTAAAPGVRVLATSRVRPGLPGERTLTVEPLPVSDPETGQPGDADALFAERAAAVVPGFALDAATRRQVAAVCRSLDGMPLAIELAAARLSGLTLGELESRLGARSARLDLLTADGDDDENLSRHHALRTTIGWSHELCAPLERLLWARLSVFAGSFTPEAATWVCAGGPLPADQVGEGLDRLVACSIVQPGRADPTRFRMLDTVREYGADWLRELGEEEAVRQRHRDHYRRLLRQAWAEWNTGRQVTWCERLLSEHANVRAAVHHALDGTDRPLALEMAANAGFLWRHCGPLRDARHVLERALAGEMPSGGGGGRGVVGGAPPGEGRVRGLAGDPPPGEAGSRGVAGDASSGDGRARGMAGGVSSGEAGSRGPAGDAPPGEASTPAKTGDVLPGEARIPAKTGDVPPGEPRTRASAGDVPPGEARTRALWALGATALFQGDLETLAACAGLAADSAREQGDPAARMGVRYLEGGWLVLCGRPAEAVPVLAAEPWPALREDGFGTAQLQTWLVLSYAHLMLGAPEAARAAAVRLRDACAQRGECWAGAFADYVIAQIDLAQGDAHAAARGLRTAIRKHDLMHNAVGLATALDTLAAASVALGDGTRAARLHGIAHRIWDLTGGEQMSSPDLIAARRACELGARGAIGDAAYDKEYAEGRTLPYEEALRYATGGT